MRIIGQRQFFLSVSPAEGLDIRLWKRHSWELLSSALMVITSSVMNDMNVGQRLYDAGRITAQQPARHHPSFRDAWTREITLFMSADNSQRITDK
jgi:hypothetical protein